MASAFTPREGLTSRWLTSSSSLLTTDAGMMDWNFEGNGDETSRAGQASQGCRENDDGDEY